MLQILPKLTLSLSALVVHDQLPVWLSNSNLLNLSPILQHCIAFQHSLV